MKDIKEITSVRIVPFTLMSSSVSAVLGLLYAIILLIIFGIVGLVVPGVGQYASLLASLGVALLVAAFGWQVGLLAWFVHINYYLAGSAAVNAVGHHFGRRPYPNSATNLQWLALITAGEGLHNNHHAAPTSAKLAHRWYEIDPAWFVIKPLTWVRLAKVRLSALRLAASQTPKAPATAA